MFLSAALFTLKAVRDQKRSRITPLAFLLSHFFKQNDSAAFAVAALQAKSQALNCERSQTQNVVSLQKVAKNFLSKPFS